MGVTIVYISRIRLHTRYWRDWSSDVCSSDLVRSYAAEKREEIVFTKGAHRLFRNIARSMTGVSATTAGSTVIVGVVGVLIISLGGRAVLNGEMTLGELIMYMLFIGDRKSVV